VIVSVAFCPHPPALLPQLAQGAAAELAQVRAAAFDAVRTVASGGLPVLVLGTGACDQYFPPGSTGSMAGFGVDLRVSLGIDADAGADADAADPVHQSAGVPGSATAAMPLPLTVGAWLLRETLGGTAPARGWSVAPAAAAASVGSTANTSARPYPVAEVLQHAGPDCALLVMGDGSARRSVTAPGYLDDRAVPFDARVAEALASGDPDELAALDPVLGAQLLAAGVPAWHAAAAVLALPTGAGTRYDATLLLHAAPYGVGYFVAIWQVVDGGGR
jgi:hypothetical protein